ncbi:hypothetical protein COT69_00945 [candidate division WWE3 bacterium CG09_land_8_20_14_0_10_39_24]|uniref:Ribbon-helix-helix protein CopG domain-containing protein n=2 Tax=Katanobacteria TaxID=422282 RepID=A0A2G9XC37_UNCKA|nr:MAG: hypothetical protein AUJ94_00515 [bacterium CG2_30_40_12]OJI09320.1 MAG: hypothetical protein BK003_00925 [bacterium CG09_39_24]PIP04524.1 MAG: hypothetical protein COX53_02050 [candidate division WWE3 bacterium CG23_combo_of_CG06-09_8_20_14_all_40_14]PIS13024.1 MAG: hypothetical protein COT69_00945 [candidate division WWE3 bacterium CG09_land_8_20_14_0_10_39_24]PJE51806.1 MAG: hypothetical protein COV27_01395 [candidate division WWE3 bacterium CG10_big_fil_rev_8_21_14_0_10_39_14]
MTRKIVSLSLSDKAYKRLNQIQKQEDKSRSELIRGLLEAYDNRRSWDKVVTAGRPTKNRFNIKSEQDIIDILND